MTESVRVRISLTGDGLNTNFPLPGPLWDVDRVYVGLQELAALEVEVPEAGPSPAEPPFWRQTGATLSIVPILAAGQAVVVECAIPGPVVTNQVLEKLVLDARLGDHGPALVWADWLQLQGDVRGEAVAAAPHNAAGLLKPGASPRPAYTPRLRLSLQRALAGRRQT